MASWYLLTYGVLQKTLSEEIKYGPVLMLLFAVLATFAYCFVCHFRQKHLCLPLVNAQG